MSIQFACDDPDIVREYIKKFRGDIFLDIGAYEGFYSINLKDNFKVVIAFEVNPENYIRLLTSLCEFHADNVVPLKLAVGKEFGRREFWEVEGLPKLGSLVKHCYHRKQTIVNVVTLDSLFEDFTIDLAKVDVEGGELDVLLGSEKCNVKNWILEVHLNHNQVEELLRRRGYEVSIISVIKEQFPFSLITYLYARK